MLNFTIERHAHIEHVLTRNPNLDFVEVDSSEERVRLLILRDLMRLGWEMSLTRDVVSLRPPAYYDKKTIRESMEIKRQELIGINSQWIQNQNNLPKTNLAKGSAAWKSDVQPEIEICKTHKQFDTFRILRFYWSSPYSEYVGRRIKLIVRDGALPDKPVIGIAALGSSIIHIPERDNWVGWDVTTRTRNLVYSMDAYVLGALPPYNHLLGGKLMSYILASNEVREIFRQKYQDRVTSIYQRTASDLVCLFTTSLYGKSSQYNRLNYQNKPLYLPIGHTKGYGTLHLTDETFRAMRSMLLEKGVDITNRFGDGPIWRMRVMRTAAELLGFDADFLLRHSFKRQIFAVPLAKNFKEFLNGEDDKPLYNNYPMAELVSYWRERWLNMRKNNLDVKRQVLAFEPHDFRIV
jgi:hypothetical protein